MTEFETTPGWGRQGTDPAGDGPTTQKVGIPVVVTLVEAPACHLCDDAKSTLAALAQEYPMTVHVLSIGDEPGRTPDEHSALKTT